MKRLTHKEFIRSLEDLGIGPGDIVHVQSDLRRIGPVDAPLTFEGLCGFYFECFREVLGPEGTLSVLTSYEDYARFGKPFIYEESPSQTDTLGEYVRRQPGTIRSLHPIISVSANGGRAEEIAGGPHFDGFGHVSPWRRLHDAGAKILSLGLSAAHGGATFLHYCEQHYGLPYLYTKIFDTPVFKDGKEVPGPFTMTVRYLDYAIAFENKRVKARMTEEGYGREVATGRAKSWCVRAPDFFDCMMRYLSKHPANTAR